MATWEFLSKRRRMKLEDFVKGAKTLEEAKAVFERKKVDLPVESAVFSPRTIPFWSSWSLSGGVLPR